MTATIHYSRDRLCELWRLMVRHRSAVLIGLAILVGTATMLAINLRQAREAGRAVAEQTAEAIVRVEETAASAQISAELARRIVSIQRICTRHGPEDAAREYGIIIRDEDEYLLDCRPVRGSDRVGHR